MIHTDDYNDVLTALMSGRNILITGSAGSGKSWTAKEFAKTAKYTIMTATTGIAALIVKGETIHRALKLGITARPEEAGKIINRWQNIKSSNKKWDKEAWKNINSVKTIIIDEASMLRKDQFELIDVVLSNIKEVNVPFGGLQIILVADFFQLPPVVTNWDLKRYDDLNNPYCFQSDLWNQAGFQSFNLTSSYRQSDENFLTVLEKIRIGYVDQDVIDMLSSRVNVDLNIPMSPVKLFSHKADVSSENIKSLKQLPGEKLVSDAEITGKKYDADVLTKECPAEKELYFCNGAQVMMLTNDNDSVWVNGTMGIIRSTNPVKIQLSNGAMVTVSPHKWERKTMNINPFTGATNYKTVATLTQYPFRLAYASTIHRCQGLTLDYVDLDLSRCFAPGQAYVALSRAKTLEGLRLRGWNKSSIITDPRVLKFYVNKV